jgi:NADH-quinone oxidoreductase subunit F
MFWAIEKPYFTLILIKKNDFLHILESTKNISLRADPWNNLKIHCSAIFMVRPRHKILPKKPFPNYQAYLRHFGPFPTEKIQSMKGEDIVRELDDSGLRGRGGAGFPTGRKWRSYLEHPCPTRYVVCNAAEGEPGTFKDRYLLRFNPYAVLEGMVIAYRALSAKKIYIAIKGSFKKEIKALHQAIGEMKKTPTLKRIPLEIIEGPEEYLFGEEKALLNVIEKEGPFPRPVEKPPFEVGLFATPGHPNPALVNNVQTFAHVATILRFGASSFRRLGTKNTPGTILFTLSGAIRRPGVYEVEAGIPIRELLMEHGKGPLKGRRFKAVLPGVSTALIPAKKFSTRADFDSLQKIGSGLASAGFIVLDSSSSIPRVAQAVARFLFVESCTQCSACKEGLRRASQMLDHLLANENSFKDPLLKIRQGAESAPQGNRCYLPVQGANLIPSFLDLYPKEFARQLKGAGKPGAVWPIPKMIDFDEKKRIFILDPLQSKKQPDWTYQK